MTLESADGVGREERLDAVVTAYLRELDSGREVDRPALLALHPDLLAELNAFFDQQDRLRVLAEPLRRVARAARVDTLRPAVPDTLPFDPQLPPQPAAGVLVDYELLGEIARGGMGVVFKARHRRLNRLVALKLLASGPFAPEGVRQRFRNEAEAVAGLDHPNIVPIYDVGEENGTPYFSMKLMEGGSLADHLARFRREPKAVARVVVDVARAVHYAHQRGILHRDLKPTNVLLDAAGQAYVTDFGLLRRVGESGGPELTRSGDVIGTPGYMAPEQASGRRAAVTTASDVYGLGALLYGLLTGEAPFHGEDVLEVLARVSKEEPKSPAQKNPAVEPDLALVCLKCLQKEPGRRYPDAGTVADELQRYLDGRPLLRTRAVGPVERVARWYRRNRAIASLAGLVAVSLVAVALVSTVYAFRLAAANERERRSRAVAVDVVDRFTTRVSESRELRSRGLEHLRAELLRDAESYYGQLVGVGGDDAAARKERGRALWFLGQVEEALGARDEAERRYDEAEQVFATLAAEQPGAPGYREGLGEVLHRRATLRQLAGRYPEAGSDYDRARSLRQQLVREAPENASYRQELARTEFQIGRQLQVTGRPDLARQAYAAVLPNFERRVREDPGDPDGKDQLASVHNNLGLVYLLERAASPEAARGNRQEALKNFQRAVELGEQALAARPEDAGFQDNLAQHLQRLGNAYKTGDAAAAAFDKAVALREALVRDHGGVPDYRLKLAILLHARARLDMYREVRQGDAAATFARALALCAKLAGDYPPDYPTLREERTRLAFDAACCHALAAASAAGPASEADAVEAVRLLRQAREAGFWAPAVLLNYLKNDGDLKSLRDRPDFRALAAELESAATPPPNAR